MAKRFTDTEKWKRPWFRKLSTKAKLVWFYVLDNCDHCGVWPVDFELLEFQTGVKTNQAEFENWFGDKVVRFEADKYFIPSFVTFQQGELSAAKNAHKPIIAFLEKHKLRLNDPIPMGSGSHHDGSMMGPSNGNGIGKGKEGGVGETADGPAQDISTDLTAPYLAQVKPEVQAAWVTTYRDRAWIKTELNKAISWMKAKPSRQKKDFAAFFNGWLARADKPSPYAATLRPEPKPIRYKPASEVLAEVGSHHDESLTDEERRAKAEKVREMLAKTGLKLGQREIGA